MNKSVSAPIAIGVLVVFALIAVAVGWHFMSSGPRDKNGMDLSRPSVQPSNMGEMFQKHMPQAGGRPGAGTPAAPASK
jgi:hypothetical protein